MSYAGTPLILPMIGANGGTSFPDYSRHNRTVTAFGDAQTSTAQSKFYGSSLLLDGTGDYLTVPNHADFDFGTGDFTVELWYFPTSQSEFSSIINRDGADFPWALYHGTSVNGGNPLVQFGSTTAWLSAPLDFGAVTANTWVHLAVTRASGTFRTFKAGSIIATDASWAGAIGVPTGSLHIGRSAGGVTYDLACRINDLRITKGVARYTANFTPPGKLIGTLSNQGTGGEPVEDDTGAPAERTIIAVPRIITPTRAFATNSDASGNFSLPVPASAEFSDLSYDVWARDDDAGTQYNDLYFGRVASV